jgi:hypothetical protein
MPMLGDYKLSEESDGSTRRVEIVDVEPGPRGWLQISRVTTDEGEQIYGRIVTPGKKSTLVAFGGGGVLFGFVRPGLKQRLKLVPGRSYRARAHGRVLVNDVKVGSHSAELHYTLVGMETRKTPAGAWVDALRFDGVLELRATERGSGRVLETLETSSDWYVEGVGWVASHYESKTWQDGVVVDDTGPVDAWLVEGVVGGASVQLPPP